MFNKIKKFKSSTSRQKQDLVLAVVAAICLTTAFLINKIG